MLVKPFSRRKKGFEILYKFPPEESYASFLVWLFVWGLNYFVGKKNKKLYYQFRLLMSYAEIAERMVKGKLDPQ